MDTSEGTQIVNRQEAARYEIFVDGVRRGYAEYALDNGVVTFTHTVTDPQMRSKGLAGRVVKQALDEARAAGLRVVPRCWFVAQFIDRHPEYQDLLAPPRSQSNRV